MNSSANASMLLSMPGFSNVFAVPSANTSRTSLATFPVPTSTEAMSPRGYGNDLLHRFSTCVKLNRTPPPNDATPGITTESLGQIATSQNRCKFDPTLAEHPRLCGGSDLPGLIAWGIIEAWASTIRCSRLLPT